MKTSLVFVLFTIVGCSFAAISQDKITGDLPLYDGDVNFDQYSGYITVDDVNERALFYWFVESQNDPANDPVVLWLNGGPGCSSMDGFFYEHGPFRFERSTTGNIFATDDNLEKNPNAWNRIANVIYLESPAGVGFSYSNTTSDYRTNDNKTAEDAYNFLQSFFNGFPEYSGNEFYVAGESYAGVYVPTLAALIDNQNEFTNNPFINLKGILVGNGVTDEQYDSTSFFQFAYNHGLYSPNIYQGMVDNNCLYQPSGFQCDKYIVKLETAIGNINIYDIYKGCYDSKIPSEAETQYNYNPLRSMDKKNNVGLQPPCVNSAALTTYLNRADVRETIHAMPASMIGPWEICSDKVKYHKLYPSVVFAYEQLAPKYRILVYSGDADGAVPYVGTSEWIQDFEEGNYPLKDWVPWAVLGDGVAGYDPTGQVAGYASVWDNLNFITIKGAGHMVPQYKPVEAFAFFSSFMNSTFP